MAPKRKATDPPDGTVRKEKNMRHFLSPPPPPNNAPSSASSSAAAGAGASGLSQPPQPMYDAAIATIAPIAQPPAAGAGAGVVTQSVVSSSVKGQIKSSISAAKSASAAAVDRPPWLRKGRTVVEHEEKSWVWDHSGLSQDDSGRVWITCFRCSLWDKHWINQTSNMIRHLARVHRITNSDSSPATNASSARSFLPHMQHKAMVSAAIEWVVSEQIPYNVLNSDGFRAMFKIASLNSSQPPPCYRTLQSAIKSRYDRTVANLKAELTAIGSVASITIDGWTSVSGIDYCAVSAHFFDSEWNLITRCLGLMQLHAEHEATSIVAHVRSILSQYLVQPFRATCDRGANYVKALSLLPVEQITCLCHSLNCSVHSAFDHTASVNDIRTKVRSVYDLFKNSPQRLKYLLTAQDGGTTPKKMIRDVVTRWNSILFMLRRAVVLKNAIAVSLARMQTDGVDVPTISPEQWRVIDEILRILSPIEVLSRHSEGSLYVTASVIPIRYIALKREISELKLNETAAIAFRSSLMDQLNRRGNEQFLANETLLRAACLDPRLKDLWWMYEAKSGATDDTKSLADRVKARLIADYKSWEIEHKRLHPPPMPPVPAPPAPPPAVAVDAKLPPLFEPPIPAPVPMPVVSEIESWFNPLLEPRHAFFPMSQSTDPIHWWKTNADRYPNLSEYAKLYLSIQASAAPVERIWSHAGRMVNRRRCTLSAEHIAEQVFLYENSALDH